MRRASASFTLVRLEPMRRFLVAAVVVSACSRTSSSSNSDSARGGVYDANAAPLVADIAIAVPAGGKDGEWTMPGRDYSNSRYSALDQITSANVSQLKVAWTFSTGVLRGHEGQPLVVDNTMYLVTPYPNVAYAIDLTNPRYPLKWK